MFKGIVTTCIEFFVGIEYDYILGGERLAARGASAFLLSGFT